MHVLSVRLSVRHRVTRFTIDLIYRLRLSPLADVSEDKITLLLRRLYLTTPSMPLFVRRMDKTDREFLSDFHAELISENMSVLRDPLRRHASSRNKPDS